MLLITRPGILDHSFVSTREEYLKAWEAPLYVLPIPSFLPTSMQVSFVTSTMKWACSLFTGSVKMDGKLFRFIKLEQSSRLHYDT